MKRNRIERGNSIEIGVNEAGKKWGQNEGIYLNLSDILF